MEKDWVRYVEITLIVFVIVSLILKFIHMLNFKIGWDEFFYLSKIYEFKRGSLTSPFQNFHVHFFQWLPLVSANEVTQIVWGRGVMFLLLLGSCLYFYLIGRYFFNRPAVLFALLCYLSLSNIIVHGASFRYDSIGSFLFLATFYHLLRSPSKYSMVILSATLMAVSLVLSIKAAFHIVTIIGLLLLLGLLSGKPAQTAGKLAVFSLTLLTAFFALFAFQTSTIKNPGPSGTGNAEFLASVFSKLISFKAASVGLPYFADTYIKNTFIWAFLFLGIYLTIRKYVTEDRNYRYLLSLSTLIPFGTLFFYRNSFPYFYVYIIAPGFILCGVLTNNLIENYREKGSWIPLAISFVLILPLIAGSGAHYYSNFQRSAVLQKDFLQQVHRIFPEPVPYIDGCSAVASFPKVGFFMSTWGMESYLKNNRPIMRELLARDQPKFLLANIPSLNLSLPRENRFTETHYALLPEDWRTLRENFIHYWNLLYLPGKEFSFGPDSGARKFEILISGTYKLEGKARVAIDGNSFQPGETFYLSQGDHEVAVSEEAENVRLLWGENIYKPDSRMGRPSFYGFQIAKIHL